MYVLPQEVEVWYILPAIRREFARILIREYKITYAKTGKLLGITRSAVSQYLSSKRAAKIKIHPKAIEEIKESAVRIVKNRSNALAEMQQILTYIRKNRLHCEICGKLIDGKLCDCKQIIPMYLDED